MTAVLSFRLFRNEAGRFFMGGGGEGEKQLPIVFGPGFELFFF